MLKDKVIDIHMHICGAGDSMAGCRMSNEFILSPAFAAMLMSLNATPFDINDDRIKEMVLNIIETSENTDHAVLLALDWVYRNGRYVKSESHFVVPNDYISGIAKNSSRVLFGASVHPYRERKEMLHETMKCIDNGAVLFKWIPSSQQIDPEDDRCLPFYKILAREGVPLLCCIGADPVPASGHWKVNYSKTSRLEKALDMGVKVIVVAHCIKPPYCDSVPHENGSYFDKLLSMLRMSEERGWKLYADISSFCNPEGMTYIERLNKEINNGALKPWMFLYGSGFPMPMVDKNIISERLNRQDIHVFDENRTNPLDDNYRTLREMGVHDSIFTNAGNVLKL